ncbi:MAG: type VI secretion system tube protein Hcp [Bacteroidetes bacterium]|nr:MAG: type VI secretion system tube protein Hcp [Bacteroidota bacterium]
MKNYPRFVLLLSLLLLAMSAFAQNGSFYVKIKSAKQGDITGDVIEKGKEGQIKALTYSHEILSPRDAASGLASGKRQHKPFVITKELDKASTKLATALVNNENLTEVTLYYYRVSRAAGATGMMPLFFTVKLTNASVVSIKTSVNAAGTPVEEIQFTYQKITWTYADGNLIAEDNW